VTRLRRVLTGAVAGGAATVPMSAVMLAARRAHVMRSPQPPEEILERAAQRAGVPARRKDIRPLAVAAHLAFGAAAGAVFALLARGPRRARLVEGAAFGAGVWFVSYRGWLPELGLMPEGARDEPERQATMLVAHLVYGATLGAATVR
jgi:uncharacterized membrane protein YagU involved in acid resistance